MISYPFTLGGDDDVIRDFQHQQTRTQLPIGLRAPIQARLVEAADPDQGTGVLAPNEVPDVGVAGSGRVAFRF